MSSHADRLGAAPDPTVVAAVDLGSNSFHMMVARSAGTDLQVIDRLREPVRLAAGLDARRRLTSEAESRALACLQRFGQRLSHIPRERVRAVGTNTLRRLQEAGGASGGFVERAEAALGHSIEIISGVEEARLVYGGVIHGMGGSEDQRRLVVDIGGGSTEVIIGRGATAELMESVGMGCVVHQTAHFADGTISRSRFRQARFAARLELEFLENRYRRAGWDVAIGASGTVRGVWRVMREQGWADEQITRDGLEKTVELVIDRGHVSKIDFPALRDDRRPVFAGGLAVLAGVFDALDLQRMQTSDRALREGLIYDLLGRLADHDVRDESVQAMALRYGVDAAHAAAVNKTALKLLGQICGPWQLERKAATTLLGWAATLHEIGLVIAHSSYQKHGEYILRHADLQGFSQTDQKQLAALVRLHRSKFSESALNDLPATQAETIRKLATLLRLATLLHRSRAPDLDPPVSIRSGSGQSRRQIDLAFPRGWLAAHPLTQADLQQEADYLKSADVRLRFE